MIDLITKKYQNIELCFLETLCSSTDIDDFILRFMDKIDVNNFKDSVYKYIPVSNIKTITKDEKDKYLFRGFVIITDHKTYLALEMKAKLDRGIESPDTEFNIVGPKDSFTENIMKNMGLIRKRIKSRSLGLIEKHVGVRTDTKICIMYLDDVIDHGMLDDILLKIDKLDIDGIIDSGVLANLIVDDSKTSFPTIEITERPDKTCSSILNGKVAILVDNSPYALLIPSFMQDYFQASEDYYLNNYNATITRILRFMAAFITILLPAFYIAVTSYNQEILPTSLLLNLASQREGVPFPAFVEIIIMIFTFEILKESDIRLPSKISSAVSTVGGLVLGTAAVSAGIISPIMVIVVALTAICSLVFSSIEMINALRGWRLVFIIFASLFGMVGIMFGILLLTINISKIEVFGKPYLLPFAPISDNILKDSIIKASNTNITNRPTYLAKGDVKRSAIK